MDRAIMGATFVMAALLSPARADTGTLPYEKQAVLIAPPIGKSGTPNPTAPPSEWLPIESYDNYHECELGRTKLLGDIRKIPEAKRTSSQKDFVLAWPFSRCVSVPFKVK